MCSKQLLAPGMGSIHKDHADGELLPKEDRIAALNHCFTVTRSREEAWKYSNKNGYEYNRPHSTGALRCPLGLAAKKWIETKKSVQVLPQGWLPSALPCGG